MPPCLVCCGMFSAVDTCFIIFCSAMVMLMTPGIGFFYSGMVRSNNAIATIMHSYMKICVVTLVWVLFGYGLVFGESFYGLFSYSPELFGLVGIKVSDIKAGTTLPTFVFVAYQCMFASVTAAVITGAFAERVKLIPILFVAVLWIVLVYCPVAHWIWGGGWIARKFEVLDFAGGAVVHINSGVAGLVAALVIGKRVRKSTDHRPHNLPLAIIGAALLWFGWFGFNAGSALAANTVASIAFVNTLIAAAAGGVGWFIVEHFHKKRSTSIGIISGSISGLVAITPAAGFVLPWAAIIIGFVGAVSCYVAVSIMKPRFGYDDSLDAFGIHGFGGIVGSILTAVFATKSVNEAGLDGLLLGNTKLFVDQLIVTGIIICYSMVATYIILKVVTLFVNIRVTKEAELKGLDNYQHGEIGYNMD